MTRKTPQRPWQEKALRFFEASSQRVFTRGELAQLRIAKEQELEIPTSLSAARFITFLEEHGRLKHVKINPAPKEKDSDKTYKSFPRYVWGAVSPLEVALSLRGGSYLTHASAVFMHGLTDQLPKTVYANKEQSPKPSGGSLTQAAIDRAFANQPRTSNYIFEYESNRIVLLNGKNTARLEVITKSGPNGETLDVTGLERTLIDITVRPVYAGGPFEVLKAFEGARERASVGTLLATLRKLEYVYPYHQAIGFYMERAGYKASLLDRVAKLGIEYDFYLTNRMPGKKRDSRWRLYYPEGF